MFQWLFKYPAADFARGTLILAGTWPLAAYLAVLLLGAAALIALAVRRHRAMGGVRISVIALLQVAMLALALLLPWQPSLFLRSLRSGENTVAVLLDTSQSMGLSDGGVSRLAQARAALASAPLAQLGRDYQIRRYEFAAGAEPVEDFSHAAPTGTRTAIGAALEQVLMQLRTTPLGAVVLLSDGADNQGALPAQQLAAIAAYGVPVHAVGFGRERMPEDLELQDVLLPEHALPGTTLSARVSVRHDGGGSARLSVYDGGRFLAGQDIVLPEAATLTTAPINLTLNDSGYRELTFTLEPKAGERELRNNTRTRVVDVASERAAILYVEGEPRWEYKFMRRALDKDSGVRLASLLRTTTNGYYRQGLARPDELKDGFPTDRGTLFAYSALIIGSVPAAWFTPAQQLLIRDFVSERGGTLLMLAGPQALGDGGWGDTPVARLLPAQLPSGESFHRVRGQAELTARGARAPMLTFNDDASENAKLWRSLPPLADYQDLGPLRLAASTLLTLKLGEHEQPLLVSQPYGRGHVLILASGGTWRWRMGLPYQDARHEQFWRQLARALVSEAPPPFDLSARVQGDAVQLRAEVRDAAFTPLADLTLAASAGGTPLSLKPVPNQPGVYAAEFRPESAGTLLIEASAQRGARALGTAHAVVHFEPDAEFFSVRQNRALLEQLAQATGARYWPADALAGLPAAIRASSAGVMQQEILPLWDAPAVFLLLLLLKCGEWLLRRRWGAV